jgi:hypothetical protein
MATKPMANATPPTDAQIHDAVVGIIAGFAKKNPAQINDADELSADLRIPDESMPFLAMALRAYVKHFRPDRTIAVADVRKPKQTVKGIADVVRTRIKA